MGLTKQGKGQSSKKVKSKLKWILDLFQAVRRKENRIVRRYFIGAAIAYLGWIYFQTLDNVDFAIMRQLQNQTVTLSNAFKSEETPDYQAYHRWVEPDSINEMKKGAWRFYVVNGEDGLHIAPSCDGKSIMFLFASFVLIFPGVKLIRRLLYGILGLIVLFEFNVIRCTILVLLKRVSFEYFSFFHHYIFQITIYLILFLLIVYFVKSPSKKSYAVQALG